MDIRMDNLLPILGTISSISPGDKLRVKQKNMSIEKRLFQGIWRNAEGEGRDATIIQLNEIYKEIDQKIDKFIYDLSLVSNKYSIKHIQNTAMISNILKSTAEYIGESYKGINNLCKTYSGHPNVVARLKYIMKNYITIQYNKINDALDAEYKPKQFTFGEKIVYDEVPISPVAHKK